MKKTILLFVLIFSLIGKPGKAQDIFYERPYISPDKLPSYLDEMQSLRSASQPKELYRYYILCQYVYRLSPETFFSMRLSTTMDSLVNKVSQYSSAGFEANFMLYLHHEYEKEYFPYLNKALQIQPEAPEVWEKSIDYYYYYNMIQPLKPLLHKMLNSGIIPAFVIEYSRNVLNSVEKNGILFTNGFFDTYPLLILQYVYNIRKDIKVVPLFSYLTVPGYKTNNDELNKLDLVNFLINKKQESPVYFPLTMDKNVLEVYASDLYVTGLAFKYDPDGNTTTGLLKNNYETMQISTWFSFNSKDMPPEERKLYQKLTGHYLLPLLNMEDYYNATGQEEKAALIRQTIDEVALVSGNTVLIEKRRSVNHLTH